MMNRSIRYSVGAFGCMLDFSCSDSALTCRGRPATRHGVPFSTLLTTMEWTPLSRTCRRQQEQVTLCMRRMLDVANICLLSSPFTQP